MAAVLGYNNRLQEWRLEHHLSSIKIEEMVQKIVLHVDFLECVILALTVRHLQEFPVSETRN